MIKLRLMKSWGKQQGFFFSFSESKTLLLLLVFYTKRKGSKAVGADAVRSALKESDAHCLLASCTHW